MADTDKPVPPAIESRTTERTGPDNPAASAIGSSKPQRAPNLCLSFVRVRRFLRFGQKSYIIAGAVVSIAGTVVGGFMQNHIDDKIQDIQVHASKLQTTENAKAASSRRADDYFLQALAYSGLSKRTAAALDSLLHLYATAYQERCQALFDPTDAEWIDDPSCTPMHIFPKPNITTEAALAVDLQYLQKTLASLNGPRNDMGDCQGTFREFTSEMIHIERCRTDLEEEKGRLEHEKSWVATAQVVVAAMGILIALLKDVETPASAA